MVAELTDHANSTENAKKTGDFERSVNRRAHVKESTRIEGVRSRLARVKRRRAGPEEQAKNWEDTEETHEAGRAGTPRAKTERRFSQCPEVVL